jgi:hypothetical protein
LTAQKRGKCPASAFLRQIRLQSVKIYHPFVTGPTHQGNNGTANCAPQ